MNAQEAAQVLAHVAAFDRRQPDPTMAQAWAEALDPALTVKEAITAVVAHYRTRREWITVADINNWATEIRRKRLDEFRRKHGTPHPYGLEDEPMLAVAWLRKLMAEVAAGAGHAEATRAAWAEVERRRVDTTSRRAQIEAKTES